MSSADASGHSHDHDHREEHQHPVDEGSFFDERASSWDDDPATVARAEAVAAAIRGSVALSSSTRLLEYGAGTGLVAQALVGDVGTVTVSDPSSGMRAVMEAKVESGVLADADVWDLDLTRDPVPTDRFDLIVTVMVLHHVHDLDRVLSGFTEMLEAGGHLCIADLDAEDGSFHDDSTHAHHAHDGFERDALERRLAEAGFGNVTFQDCTTIERNGREFGVFLATAGRDN